MTNPLHTVLGTRAQRLAEPLPPQWVRVVCYAVLLVLGLLVSICGSFVQALWSPGGLLLTLAAGGALSYGGLRLTGTKLGAGVPLIGWFLALLVLLAPRPEGDIVFGAFADAYVYVLLGWLPGLACALLPTRSPFAFGIPRQRD
ncbi:DUF6113 family protein [Kitasatospora sp. NBC_01287]|uniref:DUF6113 family protein n=1 Tax=Kitasatospora sp. NBC_01287 TaxID=2903573 RepID=UPI002253CF63|nr:DUF6113 family protein [Kitasatospora sp. NBC_01287]MCX4746954.1 DUF6113 family protein [Kitasatospora sp. NBC_01287]